MSPLRILHVDDEFDIREIVEVSLGLDPSMETRSCASGLEALAVASDWLPDVIVLDAMMPVMDGPTTLARLRDEPRTARIPVVLMTARAQSSEINYFRSLGAAGVISKPFDPMTLAATIRSHVQPTNDRLEALRNVFLKRVANDTAALTELRSSLMNNGAAPVTLARIGDIAHGLAGAGGIFGFFAISESAAALDAAVKLNGSGSPGDIARALDNLLVCLEASHSLKPAVH